jgi:hypothetical protein
MAHSSGKMLMASNNSSVGATNSQAIARSDRLPSRHDSARGVLVATRSNTELTCVVSFTDPARLIGADPLVAGQGIARV